MFHFTERFSKYVCPIQVGVNFNHFNVTSSDMILKAVPFEGDMFSSDFGALTVSQNNAGCIILINGGCL